jgi:hypothetical protein
VNASEEEEEEAKIEGKNQKSGNYFALGSKRPERGGEE